MADDWVRIVTGPTKAALADIDRRADRATMYGLRAVGRKVKQEARRRAPVYQGSASTVTIRQVRAARKLGGGGDGGGQVVSGLLKDSISSSRRLGRTAGGGYRLGIAPRGPRVHLYAAKIEGLRPYMRPGWEAAQGEMEAVFMKVWTRATTPR